MVYVPNTSIDIGRTQKEPKGKGKQQDSRTLLEALAQAIDGTNEEDAVRLAEEFNNSFGHLVRASVDVESVRGETAAPTAEGTPRRQPVGEKKRAKPVKEPEIDLLNPTNGGDGSPPSSDDSDVKKPRKKKAKKNASKKKRSKQSESSSSSDDTSSKSSPYDSDSDVSSQEEDAELCYEVTDFESADLPDLPDRWDKGFKKLRSYVPLTLFNPALLESFHKQDGDQKDKSKSAKSKSSLKALEKQLTYGDFIEMSNLEEGYAREIYGLDTYADYVVKHKKIVSDLKKTYNCWMIGLCYHLKVRTVMFRRRKLIKLKVNGKTVIKDKVKIPNGLQPTVERQARHDADRAGDLQYVDNPYAPGGAKFGFNFATGRAQVTSQGTAATAKVPEESTAQSLANRGKRGNGSQRPYARRGSFMYPRGNRFVSQAPYHVF